MISIPKSAVFRVPTATVAVVNSSVVSSTPVISKKLSKVSTQKPVERNLKSGWPLKLPTSAISACVGLGGPSQVRFSHTDIKYPSFDAYRRQGNLDPNDVNKSEDSSRVFTYVQAGAAFLGTFYVGKILVVGALNSLAPTKDILALAKIEVNLSGIPEGKTMVFKWRGKPLFVKHRTAAEIETENNVDLSTLRDGQHDEDRVKNPEWLVILGICTHLGCVPVAEAGEFGGYYCPCHGSHYDGSGRIRKGPAPLNLEVPYYEFIDENNIVVG